jgi:hypothetical protein
MVRRVAAVREAPTHGIDDIEDRSAGTALAQSRGCEDEHEGLVCGKRGGDRKRSSAVSGGTRVVSFAMFPCALASVGVRDRGALEPIAGDAVTLLTVRFPRAWIGSPPTGSART